MRKEKIQYPFYDYNINRMNTLEVEYTLIFQHGKLTDVKNGYGFSVEKNSWVWEYFNKQN